MATSDVLSIEFISAERMSIEHRLIDSIGTVDFLGELAKFLKDYVDVDECRTYSFSVDGLQIVDTLLGDGEPTTLFHGLGTVERHWIQHPSVSQSMTDGGDCQPVVIRVDPSRISDLAVRDLLYRRNRIRDMVMVWGARGNAKYGLTITRSLKNDAFSDEDIRHIASISGPLISSIAKHIQVLDGMRSPFHGLKSLREIENVISRSDIKLPRRELEVCSHILNGISIAGIALALGIADESVVTYRKRSYQRLGIGSRHELLMWYLGLASAHRLDGPASASPPGPVHNAGFAHALAV